MLIFFSIFSMQLEVLWRKHGDYACMMQEEEESRMKNGEDSENNSKEKEGEMLLSHLKVDMASRQTSSLSGGLC